MRNKSKHVNRWGEEKRKLVRELYLAGYTYRDITSRTGVSSASIADMCRDIFNRGRACKKQEVKVDVEVEPPMETILEPVQENVESVILNSGNIWIHVYPEHVLLRGVGDEYVRLDKEDFSILVKLLIKADKIAEVI